jgi:hypothetical protein
MNNTRYLLAGLLASFVACAQAGTKPADAPVTYKAPQVKQAPVIDGNPKDASWTNAPWRRIDQLTAGKAPSNPQDFSGRYKVVWTPTHLYILAEVNDDILIDSHPDPLSHYWDDDTLEVFIDEDSKGGNHLFTYDAFAYHISLDNQAVDMGPFLTDADKKADKANIRLYPNHITSQWKRSKADPHTLYWEVQLTVYPNTYKDEYKPTEKPIKPAKLTVGKKMGFMMAYCDSDSPNGRDHFIGDVNIAPVNGDKNRGYIDAGVFGVLELTK